MGRKVLGLEADEMGLTRYEHEDQIPVRKCSVGDRDLGNEVGKVHFLPLIGFPEVLLLSREVGNL